MIDTSKPFWQRKGNMAPYAGLKQGNVPHCVFASIGGAINHLVGRTVWEGKPLFDHCVQGGLRAATFDGVIPFAIKPVQAEITYEIPREQIKGGPVDEYLRRVKDCVASDGIAIVSLEFSNDSDPTTPNLGDYHMISLVAQADDGYQVWDTNDMQGFVTEHEIETGFAYRPVEIRGQIYQSPYLVRHPDYDCLLLRNR